MYVLAVLFIASRIAAIMPNEITAIELRVRGLYKLNEDYRVLMGLDPSLKRGNKIYRLAHEEVDPILDWINRQLALTPEEEWQFLASPVLGVPMPRPALTVCSITPIARILTPSSYVAAAPLAEVGGVRPAPRESCPPTPDLKPRSTLTGYLVRLDHGFPGLSYFCLVMPARSSPSSAQDVPQSPVQPALRVLEDRPCAG